MAWAPPPSPTIGQTYELGDRSWVWNGAGWAKVAVGRNNFLRPVLVDGYRQTLMTTARSMPLNVSATQLQYI